MNKTLLAIMLLISSLSASTYASGHQNLQIDDNQTSYDNKIQKMTPPKAYLEICFKNGITQIDTHLSSESTSKGENCKPGDTGYIIETTVRSARTWQEANDTCRYNKMRLPEQSEWVFACQDHRISSQVKGMPNIREWASNISFPVYNEDITGIASITLGDDICNIPRLGWISNSSYGASEYEFRCAK